MELYTKSGCDRSEGNVDTPAVYRYERFWRDLRPFLWMLQSVDACSMMVLNCKSNTAKAALCQSTRCASCHKPFIIIEVNVSPAFRKPLNTLLKLMELVRSVVVSWFAMTVLELYSHRHTFACWPIRPHSLD
jgi:hypothetical protein